EIVIRGCAAKGSRLELRNSGESSVVMVGLPFRILARFIDAFRQLFRLVMLGHARPIQIYFGIAPIVLRISASEDAALASGRGARRTVLGAGQGGSPAGNGHPQSRDRDELGRDPGG